MNTDHLNASAVVLVEYHSQGLVAARAADALAAGHRTVVIDNSGAYCGPGEVIRTGGNVGFGAACNAAVASLGDDVDVVVLQNPDAFVDRADLTLLIDRVRNGPWVALAPALRADRLRTRGYAVPGRSREIALVVLDILRLRRSRAMPSDRREDFGLPDRAERPEIITAPGRFATAAVMVIDRAAYERVGGFDVRYFLYVEDLDLWERLQDVGPVGFHSGVVAEHRPASGSAGSAARRTVLRWLGRELYAADRGRSWMPLRTLHRVAARALPTEGDLVAERLIRRLRSWDHPADVQAEVRSVMQTLSEEPEA